MKLREAWAALWCDGRISVVETDTGTVARQATGGADTKAPARGNALSLCCSRGNPKTCRCPRAETFRQVVQHFLVNVDPGLAGRDAEIVNGHREGAPVDHIHRPAFAATSVKPAVGLHVQPHTVVTEAVDRVDHAEGRTKHGQSEGDQLSEGRIHAADSAPAEILRQAQNDKAAQ